MNVTRKNGISRANTPRARRENAGVQRRSGGEDNDSPGSRMNRAEVLASSRVAKRLRPDQAGALSLAQRYGDALVCVRYRQNAPRTRRYTTVELVVDEAPITKGGGDHTIVHVRIHASDFEMQEKVQQQGAVWNPTKRLWQMPLRIARKLKLLDQVRPRRAE